MGAVHFTPWPVETLDFMVPSIPSISSATPDVNPEECCCNYLGGFFLCINCENVENVINSFGMVSKECEGEICGREGKEEQLCVSVISLTDSSCHGIGAGHPSAWVECFGKKCLYWFIYM